MDAARVAPVTPRRRRRPAHHDQPRLRSRGHARRAARGARGAGARRRPAAARGAAAVAVQQRRLRADHAQRHRRPRARRLHARRLRRSVPGGRAPVPHRPSRRHRTHTPLPPVEDHRHARPRGTDDRRGTPRPAVHSGPARAGSVVRRSRVRWAAPRRSPGRRRPVRRARRVPLVRLRRADVLGATAARHRRGRHPRRLRLRRPLRRSGDRSR